MKINSVGYQQANINAFKQNMGDINKSDTAKEKSIEKTLDESAVNVSISMNARIVLFSLNTIDNTRNNTLVQGSLDGHKEMFDFLSGKTLDDSFSLKDIGYEGKPITQLTPDEANELLGEDGFFGIEQTSNRVADFVFNFAGDDIKLLQEGRKGIVRGFEEALKLFGSELPEISHKTQEKTLELIDEKIASLSQKEDEEVKAD